MAIDPNRYKDGIPLTTFDLLDRISRLLGEVDTLERERDRLKASAKHKDADAEDRLGEVRELARLRALGRPVYLLVDDTVTAEPPRDLPLWEGLERSTARASEQAKVSATVAPIFAKYGEGRAPGVAFVRFVASIGAKVLVQSEEPGAWTARIGTEAVDGGPWRAAADAMIAALEATEDTLAIGSPAEAWEPTEVVPSKPAEEPEETPTTDATGGKIAPPEERSIGRVESATVTADGRGVEVVVAPAAPASPPKTYAKSPDDGQTFRAMFNGDTLAVAQVVTPGPWNGYRGAAKVVEAADTAAEAKAKVEAALGSPALGWASKVQDEAAKVDTSKPPRRTRVAR